MKLSVALRLGRVSNLPTVWSNVLAALVLAGASAFGWTALCLLVAFSALYTAGMYLNDAFDAPFDRLHRPERPVPGGEAAASSVFIAGFAMLALGVVAVSAAALTFARAPVAAIVSAIGLACTIVLYNFWHKGNPLGPALMGLCRLLVYFTAALAVSGTLSWPVVSAGVTSLCYLIGLTYIAKQEMHGRLIRLWPLGFLAVPALYQLLVATPTAAGLLLFAALFVWVGYAISLLRPPVRNIGKAVGYLIAGISLLDAVFIGGQRQPALAAFAVICFALTLALQLVVSGT